MDNNNNRRLDLLYTDGTLPETTPISRYSLSSYYSSPASLRLQIELYADKMSLEERQMDRPQAYNILFFFKLAVLLSTYVVFIQQSARPFKSAHNEVNGIRIDRIRSQELCQNTPVFAEHVVKSGMDIEEVNDDE